MKWKSRRREVPEWLEPSLLNGALAERRGLDRLIKYSVIAKLLHSCLINLWAINRKFIKINLPNELKTSKFDNFKM